MANRKQQEKKQQQRKQIAKKRVLYRREKVRSIRKEADATERMQHHFRLKTPPIRNRSKSPEPALTEQIQVDDVNKVEWIKQKLEHNMKILDALEAEMKREEEERERIRKSLEDQGAMTMREKMDLIAKTAEEKLEVEKLELNDIFSQKK